MFDFILGPEYSQARGNIHEMGIRLRTVHDFSSPQKETKELNADIGFQRKLKSALLTRPRRRTAYSFGILDRSDYRSPSFIL